MTIVGCTGHRLQAFPGFESDTKKRLYNLALKSLNDPDIECVISGMALGWDTAVSQAALDLGISLSCIIPFPAQPNGWSDTNREKYFKILEKADHKIVISSHFSKRAYFDRSEQIVDMLSVAADSYLLALWNGEVRSGTGHCVNCAKRKGVTIKNVWGQYGKG